MSDQKIQTAFQAFHEFHPTTSGDLIDGSQPECWIAPSSVEEASKAVKTAYALSMPIVIVGSGTALSLGAPVSQPFIVLETKNLNQIDEYVHEDLTITVGGGMSLAGLQAVLSENGQYLPVNPAPSDEVSIGGALATGMVGPWRGNVPSIRDLIIGATTIQGDGTLVKSGGRVVKNVTGYDLHRLHVGALGTLGIVAETTFKVVPLPAVSEVVITAVSSEEEAISIGTELRRTGLAIRALTLLSEEVSLLLGVDESPHLLIDFAGSKSAVEYSKKQLETMSSSSPRLLDASFYRQLRRIFAGENRMILRIGVLITAVSPVMKWMHAHGMAAYSNISAGHIMAELPRSDEISESTVLDLLRELRDLSESHAGYLILERAPESIRQAFVPLIDTNSALTAELARSLDPRRLLNTGRFGGS